MADTRSYYMRQTRNRERICTECGLVEFVRKDNPSTQCQSCSGLASLAKARAARSAKAAARPTVSCKGCGSPIKAHKGYSYCTLECKRLNGGVHRTCKQCSTVFRVAQSVATGSTNASANFCSRPCYNQWQRATASPTKGHAGPGWHSRAREFKRRFPNCAWCGRLKGRLEVHHLYPWRMSHDNSDENLMTLCSRDHRWIEARTADIIEASRGADLRSALGAFIVVLRYRQRATERLLLKLWEEVKWPNSPSMRRTLNADPSTLSFRMPAIPENTRQKRLQRWCEVFKSSGGPIRSSSMRTEVS